MLDLLRLAADPATEAQFRHEIASLAQRLYASASGGDGSQVRVAEDAVAADPASAFSFDEQGFATLSVGDRRWHAGRFSTPSLAELRQRATGSGGRIRLWVLDGGSVLTDIGSLQATAGEGALFQVASQFNCLESPGPYLTRVAYYFSDSTQGPRASISAYPATLLRHYSAPGQWGRFVQRNGAPQINLLADVIGPEALVQNGYLLADNVFDVGGLLQALESRFDAIRIGLHEGAQVVLGYHWDGAVENSENRRITQVFTSTVAGGMYGGAQLAGEEFHAACRHLLRAAYLGTLLAAVTLGRTHVVLTLIGGGVFGNPVPLIWDSILWAISEVEPLTSGSLDVVVNGYNLGRHVHPETILAATRERGGALLDLRQPSEPGIYR